MGVEYAAVGRLSEAAEAYEEGLAITRRVSDTSTGGYLISNLAALRAYTGRLDQAIDLMTQSLASARALADPGVDGVCPQLAGGVLPQGQQPDRGP